MDSRLEPEEALTQPEERQQRRWTAAWVAAAAVVSLVVTVALTVVIVDKPEPAGPGAVAPSGPGAIDPTCTLWAPPRPGLLDRLKAAWSRLW